MGLGSASDRCRTGVGWEFDEPWTNSRIVTRMVWLVTARWYWYLHRQFSFRYRKVNDLSLSV